MREHLDLLDKVKDLEHVLVNRATGRNGDDDDDTYCQLRLELMDHRMVGPLLPRFVKTFRDLDQFSLFIEREYADYDHRRAFLWEQFTPAAEAASAGKSPVEETTNDALRRFDHKRVEEDWRRALARRKEDPEGALTSARRLLEE